MKGEWDNVQSLHIKTNSSASLPIWTCDLGSDEGGRWNGLVAGLSDGEESDDEVSGDEDDLGIDEEELKALQAEISGLQNVKGKKRAAEEDVEKPKKKSKATSADATEVTEKAKSTTKAGDSAAAAASVVSKKASSMSHDAITSPKQPKKRKRNDLQGSKLTSTGSTTQQSSKVTSAPVLEPGTPKPSTKKARASAVDFFEDDQTKSTRTPAPPPNTPSTGQTPIPGTSKTKKKAVPQTPVSGAIRKLATGAAGDESTENVSAKAHAAGVPPEGVAAGKKKSKKASLGAAAVPSEVAKISSLTTDELKEKKRNTPALEKKKEKLSKGKSVAKSAKEGVLGKKRV